jgi:hypothetical protein
MSIDQERIKILEAELKKLRGSKRYPHRCENCGQSWLGTKEVVKECIYCKRVFKDVNPMAYKLCAKFDSYLKRKHRFVKELPVFNRRYIFEWNDTDGNISYTKVENGETKESKTVAKSYEIMEKWDLRGFFKGVALEDCST